MIGTTISHYKIHEKIGEGGMGQVYLAEDLKLHRKVALKFLPRELIRNDEVRARFIYEAQAAYHGPIRKIENRIRLQIGTPAAEAGPAYTAVWAASAGHAQLFSSF